MRRDLVFVLVGLIAIAGLGAGGLALLNARGGGGRASSGIEEWAQTMRAAGYEVAHGEVAVKGNVVSVAEFTLAGPADSFRWRWTAPQLQILRGDDGRVALQPAGTQTLTYPVAGAERTVSFSARGLQIDVQRSEAGRVTRVVATVTGLSLTPPEGGEPVQASRIQAQLALAEGAGVIPERSSLSLLVEKLVLPELQRGPLGKTLETLSAELEFERGLPSLKLGTELPAWRAAANGRLKIDRARFNWGPLNLEAEGALGLDAEYRPEGELRARIRNLLPALDALHVARRMDAALRAEYYATLMDEMALGRAEAFDFTIRMRAGAVALAREGGGLGELTLGALPTLLPLPPAAR